jgi:hypothetical protein
MIRTKIGVKVDSDPSTRGPFGTKSSFHWHNTSLFSLAFQTQKSSWCFVVVKAIASRSAPVASNEIANPRIRNCEEHSTCVREPNRHKAAGYLHVQRVPRRLLALWSVARRWSRRRVETEASLDPTVLLRHRRRHVHEQSVTVSRLRPVKRPVKRSVGQSTIAKRFRSDRLPTGPRRRAAEGLQVRLVETLGRPSLSS